MKGWSPQAAQRVNLKRQMAGVKRSKFGNVKTTLDGQVFDSKREADRWVILKAREKAGEITELQRQVEFRLYCPTAGPDAEVCRYVADFTYREGGMALVVEDVKGVRTPVYRLKAKWLRLQDGITIREV